MPAPANRKASAAPQKHMANPRVRHVNLAI